MLFVNTQEVERLSNSVRTQSLSIDDVRKQMESAEDAVLGAEQQHRQRNEAAETLKQRLSAAEAKLEQFTAERHGLLVYAVVCCTAITVICAVLCQFLQFCYLISILCFYVSCLFLVVLL